MDVLQGKVDLVDGEVRQIADALRGYLVNGDTPSRRVKPPETKAGRDLLQVLVDRLEGVHAGISDIRNLSSSLSSPPPPPPLLPSLPLPLANGPNTPLSSCNDSPNPQHQTLPLAQAQAERQDQDELQDEPQHHPTTADPINTHQHPGSLSPSTSSHPLSLSLPPSLPLSLPLPLPQITGSDDVNAGVTVSVVLSDHCSPVFDCTYQDIHVLNEERFEVFSSHPVVKERGYFKLQVRDLPPLDVNRVERPTKDHAQSFRYKADSVGLIKVDTGKKPKYSPPRLPLPTSAQSSWTQEEQRNLWNSTARNPPKGNRPYIIGNPLFDDIELHPGEKLKQRGAGPIEGISTQYVYFNLTGKTITTMHREDAHVRSENILRSGANKFWCFVKPSFTERLEEQMRLAYPEMRGCSQAVRHLSRHIPPAQLDKWGVEYTLDYCVPGQAVVTEPGTYHQVLNLGPNYALAINLEYMSSPDDPPNYCYCDDACPDQFAISAEDFKLRPERACSEEKESAGSLTPAGTHFEVPPQNGSKQSEPAAALLQSPASTPDRSLPSQTVPTSPAKSQKPYTEGQQPVNHSTPLGPSGVSPAQPVAFKIDRFIPNGQMPAPTVQEIAHPTKPSMPENYEPASAVQSAPEPAVSVQLVALPQEYAMPSDPRPAAPAQVTIQPLSLRGQQNRQTESAAAQFTQPHPPPEYPQQHIISAQPEPTAAEAIPPITAMKAVAPKNKRRSDGPPAKRMTKKQKLDAAATRNAPYATALTFLTSLVQGCEKLQPKALPFEQICNKSAFDRLAGLVREWRVQSKTFAEVGGGMDLVNYVDEQLHGSSALNIFLRRFCKVKLADWDRDFVKTSGQQPASKESVDQLLYKLDWDESKRHKLHDYLREGKCWKTICGDYGGLLCLIPFDTPDAQFSELALFQNTVSHFHQKIDVPIVHRLCDVGKVLERSIWNDLDLPEFIWETANTAVLALDQVVPLLNRFSIIKINHFDLAKYNWQRPTNWKATWKWPSDPTSMPCRGPKQCNQCGVKTSCQCLQQLVPEIQRVSDDGSKGAGIRALGPYRKDVILGELLGELVPVGMGASTGEWTMELQRPDLAGESVAEINPKVMGNWVRKVRHSTEPSAEFKIMKITGRWRMMLVALRDITFGEEITAKFGRG
ncbi:hypothetical protein B0T22DRAFT_526953 [Podospora appendiculata]|uniref:JmjC domain-containing protein n=1 Tax=Podospora appendiculata TaxID=314037 RepID=A0AAE0XLE8_9PEZI|nr:hypothetical protein B0T22DRAFT_526953 [Podospora appendiculata]